MSNQETWRVVTAAGNAESVVVDKSDNGWWRVNGVPLPLSLCPDDAVVDYARSMEWVIAEVRAPGELTRDEAVAAMHDECLKACRATAGTWADRVMDDGVTIDDFRFDDEACEYAEIGAQDCLSAVRALRPHASEESPED